MLYLKKEVAIMNKLLFWTILLAFSIVVPVSAMAGIQLNIGIALPDAPDVYVDPDVNADLFFWNGWWWQQWEGRWYRSHYYDRGWGYYNNVPSFYYDVDPGWRGYYRDHNWYGHPWNYDRIPSQRVQQNWKGWQNSRHWEKQGTWGVQGY